MVAVIRRELLSKEEKETSMLNDHHGRYEAEHPTGNVEQEHETPRIDDPDGESSYNNEQRSIVFT
jgi:hypothetical protein